MAGPTGIMVSNECQRKYAELRVNRTYRYLVFKIDERASQIVVEKCGDPEATHEEFVDSLPDEVCRFGVYNFEFPSGDGDTSRQKSKILFIQWSPDTSPFRAKMIYASSKVTFKQELNGIHYELQATDPTEMDLEVIKERAK